MRIMRAYTASLILMGIGTHKSTELGLDTNSFTNLDVNERNTLVILVILVQNRRFGIGTLDLKVPLTLALTVVNYGTRIHISSGNYLIRTIIINGNNLIIAHS